MRQPKKIEWPVLLTEAIVHDAGADQRLLDIAARADAWEGICQGLEQSERGQGREAEAFFAEFEAIRHIPG